MLPRILTVLHRVVEKFPFPYILTECFRRMLFLDSAEIENNGTAFDFYKQSADSLVNLPYGQPTKHLQKLMLLL